MSLSFFFVNKWILLQLYKLLVLFSRDGLVLLIISQAHLNICHDLLFELPCRLCEFCWMLNGQKDLSDLCN